MRFPFIPYNPELRDFARANRKNPTKAESKMWVILQGQKMNGYLFLRQKPISHFILDFYCSKLLLAIEIDGDSHAEQIEYDEERTKILEQYNIKVVRYTNKDITGNISGVWTDLEAKIKEREKELKD